MPINNITLEQISELLLKNDNYLILCHKRPDGDTLGSALALENALKSAGKTAHIACVHKIPSNTRFLFEGRDPDLSYRDYGEVVPVAVDIASLSMMGEIADVLGNDILLKIDHHETGDDYAKYNYTEPDSAACGEIIYELIKLMGVNVSECAVPLFAAISSDTGCFRYANTTPRTHKIAAALIETGIDHGNINHNLFENRTPAEVRALKCAYGGMRFFMDGRIAAIVLTNEEKRRLELCEEDLGLLNSITREIEGVKVGITLKQDKDDPVSCDMMKFKMSVRSEKGFPANRLCALFGGGGHECAAGGEMISENADTALETIISKIGCDGEKLFIKA